MSVRSTRRVGLSALAGALVVVAGCGSSDGNETAPTITIQPQSYQAKPAAEDATAAVADTTPVTADAEGMTDQVQIYTVEDGDYPSTVASMFEVDLDDLIDFNGWTLRNGIVPEFPAAGEQIRIPPPSKVLDETTETTTAGTTADGAAIVEDSTPTSDSADADADAGADRCTPGTYTVQEGDYPGKVAERLDVDVNALNEANAATQGYNVFYVGLEIVVPPASDC